MNVPAGATLTVVVTELKSPGNGFPSALGGTYTLKVAGLPTTVGPSAAQVGVSGKVTNQGNGIGGAKVTITDSSGLSRSTVSSPLGYFRFDGVTTGESYLVQVSSKRYRFSSRIVTINDSVSDMDFEAQ